jgi:ABC-type dipeptide/oligopeptide/nickel transport system permease subunit
MMRAMALGIKNSDYVKAAEIQGGRSLYIMFRHVLPNSISPIIIMMMQNVGTTILMESGLSFLGIGVSVPIASWGTMVNLGRTYLLTNPVLAIAPGVCVALLVISLNMLGDGIRDALDPRLRGEV